MPDVRFLHDSPVGQIPPEFLTTIPPSGAVEYPPAVASGKGTAPRARAQKPAARRRRATTASPAGTGAVALVSQLEAMDVEVVFGIPGVHNLAIFDALRRSRIRTVLVRHEQTCVFAADGYARATGRLGVAITTTGPGAANTAGAMGEARASRSPVLHLSTQIDSALLDGRGGRWSLHESPYQRELMDAVGVWSATVARADAIPSMVARAAHAAFTGRRGPVFLDIPTDLLDARAVTRAQPSIGERGFAAARRDLERAVAALESARRPVIWSGGGAIASGAGGILAEVAEALDAPIVTTFAGKGIVGREHPLLVGFPPHQPEVTKLIASSDAVLVVGSDLDGMNTQGWRLPLPRPRVSINTVAEDGRRNYACDVVIEADARDALESLLPMLPVRSRGTAARRVAAVREKCDAALRASTEFRAPYRFIQTLSEVVPPDTVVIADMAVPGYWAAGYYRAGGPNLFAYPLGWGTLGFALPAAIGTASAGRRTLAVCGDAGLMYAIGELATAMQERLPLAVLVVNDEGYGMLRFDERERFGETFASDLVTPDFVAMAKSFGASARRCAEKDLGATLAWALKRPGPALVEVRARWAPPPTTSARWPLKGKPEARP